MKSKIISKGTFEDLVVKKLKNNPDELKEFQDYITEEFNKTNDLGLFLENLKIVAKAKGNIKQFAKDANVTRATVYNIFSKDSNPRIRGFLSMLQLLGARVNVSF